MFMGALARSVLVPAWTEMEVLPPLDGHVVVHVKLPAAAGRSNASTATGPLESIAMYES